MRQTSINVWRRCWFPSGKSPGRRRLSVCARRRTRLDADQHRRSIHAVDPQIALAEPKTLDQIRDESLANERFTLLLFATFAVVALFLATLGIYGVVAFSVAQRSHEIAIRMALGATRNRVVALVLREGSVLAAIGLGLVIGAYFVGRAMQSWMLFGVRALDLSAFGCVALVLLAAALLACYLPARKSSVHRAHAGAARR